MAYGEGRVYGGHSGEQNSLKSEARGAALTLPSNVGAPLTPTLTPHS